MDIGNLKIISHQWKASAWYRQAAKFGLVGILNTVLDWAIYLLLAQAFGAGPVLAKILSYSAGVLNSFYLNRSWTFHSRANFTKAFPPFLGISLAGILINSGCMYLAVYWLNLDDLFAHILATTAAFGWNFAASRRFVFRD